MSAVSVGGHPDHSPSHQGLMSVKQVADFLGVHQNYVYTLSTSGVLPSVKLGGRRRFMREDVLEWVRKHRSEN